MIPTVASVMLLAFTPLAAPVAHAQDRDDYAGWVDTTFTFESTGTVELVQVSGDVIVTTWERNEIRIRAYAERVPLETRFSQSRVYVSLDIPDRRGNSNNRIGDSQFEVTMPSRARLSAKSVSGDVSVRRADGRVSAASVSGDVTVEGGSDEITVASVSGDVQLTGSNGRVTITTVSGDLMLRDANGDVDASTVSGELTMRDVRARLVTAKSVSGDLEFAGPIAGDGRYELNSHSGTLTLRLPSDVNGRLSISTFSGDVDSDVPVTLGSDSQYGRRNNAIEAQLGGGTGGTIVAKTFSGDVVLRRSR